MNGHFEEEKIQMVHTDVKRYSNSLVMKEIQIKTAGYIISPLPNW